MKTNSRKRSLLAVENLSYSVPWAMKTYVPSRHRRWNFSKYMLFRRQHAAVAAKGLFSPMTIIFSKSNNQKAGSFSKIGRGWDRSESTENKKSCQIRMAGMFHQDRPTVRLWSGALILVLWFVTKLSELGFCYNQSAVFKVRDMNHSERRTVISPWNDDSVWSFELFEYKLSSAKSMRKEDKNHWRANTIIK